MENDILDSLNDLGYEGSLSDEATFAAALQGGPKSLEYTKLIHILAEELKSLCNLEETVTMMTHPDESSSFLLELSSFLKELGCPYKKLVTGHMSSRLQTREDRILLLDYLVSELMAARMVNVDKPKTKQSSTMDIVMQESPTAKNLKDILIALKFNKPPPNITAEMLFTKLEAKLKDTIQKEGDQLVGKPLYNKAISDKDWKQLEANFAEMYEEYRLRRETLITRLECTIQSFEWSDRLRSRKDLIQSTYRPKRELLKNKPDVRLSDFLAARTSLLLVEKTSSAAVRKNTQSDVNKVIIGQVPDRGGRPNEQQPPPPEMPSWQQRVAPKWGSDGNGPGSRGGQGGRGGQGDLKPVRHQTIKTTVTTKPLRYHLVVTRHRVKSRLEPVMTRTEEVITSLEEVMTRIGAVMTRTKVMEVVVVVVTVRVMIVWAAITKDTVKAVAAAEATTKTTITRAKVIRTRAKVIRVKVITKVKVIKVEVIRTNTTTAIGEEGAVVTIEGEDAEIKGFFLFERLFE